MSGGIGSSVSNPHKIKGGKWTVVRFFLVASAHSIGWYVFCSPKVYLDYRHSFGRIQTISWCLASRFTVSSLLGSYAIQYGVSHHASMYYEALQYDKAWVMSVSRFTLQHALMVTHFANLMSHLTMAGPDVLLKMNIFYYLPSIPLLLFSSLCDEWLDSTFGDALTVLPCLSHPMLWHVHGYPALNAFASPS